MEKLFDEQALVYYEPSQSSTGKTPSLCLRSATMSPKLASQPKAHRYKRESESDSQYFSGTDSSLVYIESSNFSSSDSSESSSGYVNNYSALPQSTAEASKALSMMTASLSQPPPSPPPLKHFSKLLNVASAAAYHL